MTESASGPERRAGGRLESGGDERPPSGAGSQEPDGGGQELNDETGVGLGMGASSTFEPEEDAG